MAKAVRYLRDESQRNIVKMLDRLVGKYSRWEVWQDFITMTAVSIANTLGGDYVQEREKMYLERARKYTHSELEVFPELLAEVVAGMERNQNQDFLGELFMALDLGNEWKGQFFTPYDVCRAMAAITYGEDLPAKIERDGWISVSDPACGAGALLIAFANECKEHDLNYQTSVLFVAQDIDFLAGCMCYIQLSLLGCAGYVVIDDSLAKPSTSFDKRGLIPRSGPQVWYTPGYCREVWHWRRAFATADMMFGAMPEKPDLPKKAPTALSIPAFAEAKNGQLTLF